MCDGVLRVGILLILIVCLVVMTACGGTSAGSSNPTSFPPVSPGTTLPSPPPPAGPVGMPQYTHVVLVVEENHSYEQVECGDALPKPTGEQQRAGDAVFRRRASLDSELFMMTVGKMITLDDAFSGTVSGDNVVSELLTAGKTWKSYAESLPAVGYNERPPKRDTA